mmetsp:Transcript_22374/g.52730  ORF Transcript_22374/g.52730 Transcript_22374/m.52730 type:complete len:625 (+) Transcript_22374:1626-3500(+)
MVHSSNFTTTRSTKKTTKTMPVAPHQTLQLLFVLVVGFTFAFANVAFVSEMDGGSGEGMTNGIFVGVSAFSFQNKLACQPKRRRRFDQPMQQHHEAFLGLRTTTPFPLSLSSSSTSTGSDSTSSPSTTTEAAASKTGTKNLPPRQLDFVLGYLNKHHSDLLVSFAETFSELGKEKAKRNAWSGGSYTIQHASLVDIDTSKLVLDVIVEQRNQKQTSGDDGRPTQRVEVELDAIPVIKVRTGGGSSMKEMEQLISNPIPQTIIAATPLDDIIRRLCRLCWIVDQPTVTGKLIQLGIQLQQQRKTNDDSSNSGSDNDNNRVGSGGGVGKIKDNLYLNQVPHNRYVRQYFYEMTANAVLESVVLCAQQPNVLSNRMQIISMFPETNPSMDSYRIGTLLELTRTIAIKLVEENLRVRVCVQGSMGVGIFTGLPKQLGGVSKLLQLMDWQSNEGEENEGMVGNYLNFGSVGAEHVVNKHTVKNEDGTTTEVEQDDVFLIIAPQSMVGVDSSIIGPLQEMVDAAGDRPVILINPDLSDKVSSQGQQNVRGRQQRMDFANSFHTIWQFQNIYVSGTSYFPILGSIFKPGPQAMYIAHQRRDLMNNDGEVYVPVLAGEFKPNGEQILDAFES